MTLAEQVQASLTEAMRNQDALRRDTLRMVSAAAYNAEKSARRPLTDDEYLAVLSREVKTRRESIEAYLTRLHRLEEIALGHPGVDKVFAMQAGRDVRVMVLPEVVDDVGAQLLARDIVKQVEEELSYPGQIKVTVVRESRAVEVAR